MANLVKAYSMIRGKKKAIFPGESVLKLNNFCRIEYFWFEITNCLSFCGFVVL